MKQSTTPLNMESDKKTKIDVVSGFLGAGKTTFIQKIIHDVYDKENVVVLENEFGKISLDGEALARNGIAVESICAGCICCTGAGKLSQNINSIVDQYHPDRIIIEPTGLARLSEVRSLLGEPYAADRCEVDRVVTIVDAKNYDHRMMISKVFFENQIRNSEVILLSKTETLEQSRSNEIAQIIQALHPGCTVISQEWEQITADQMKAFLNCKRDVLIEEKHVRTEHHHDHSSFESFSYEEDMQTEEDKIKLFLKNASEGDFGQIQRMKGVFQNSRTQWFRFEYVPGEGQIVPIAQEMRQGSKKLQVCVIGTKLDKDLLQEQLS